MDARRGAMTQQMEAMRSLMSSDTFATRRAAEAQARASRPAPDDSRLPVKALTAHRVPARWKTSRRPGRGVARARSFAAIVSRTYSLESSLISIFFWHPVAGLAMLNCGGWGGKGVSEKSSRRWRRTKPRDPGRRTPAARGRSSRRPRARDGRRWG